VDAVDTLLILRILFGELKDSLSGDELYR